MDEQMATCVMKILFFLFYFKNVLSGSKADGI